VAAKEDAQQTVQAERWRAETAEQQAAQLAGELDVVRQQLAAAQAEAIAVVGREQEECKQRCVYVPAGRAHTKLKGAGIATTLVAWGADVLGLCCHK
jgi:hypothetical protein